MSENKNEDLTQVENNESGNQTSSSGTSTGLDQNIAGLLTYLFGLITGIVFLLLEKDNRFVRFHAWQSIFVWAGIVVIFIGLSIIGFIVAVIPGVGWILGILITLFNFVLGLGTFILWIYLMIQAYQNKMVKLPFVGDLAEKQVNK